MTFITLVKVISCGFLLSASIMDVMAEKGDSMMGGGSTSNASAATGSQNQNPSSSSTSSASNPNAAKDEDAKNRMKALLPKSFPNPPDAKEALELYIKARTQRGKSVEDVKKELGLNLQPITEMSDEDKQKSIAGFTKNRDTAWLQAKNCANIGSAKTPIWLGDVYQATFRIATASAKSESDYIVPIPKKDFSPLTESSSLKDLGIAMMYPYYSPDSAEQKANDKIKKAQDAVKLTPAKKQQMITDIQGIIKQAQSQEAASKSVDERQQNRRLLAESILTLKGFESA